MKEVETFTVSVLPFTVNAGALYSYFTQFVVVWTNQVLLKQISTYQAFIYNMERLNTSLLANILSRCKHQKPAIAREPIVDDGDFAPLSSYRLVSKEWATEGLQILGTVRVLHNFEELDQSSLQRLLERAPHIKRLEIGFFISLESSKSSDTTVGSSESNFEYPPWETVDTPAQDGLLEILTDHEWVEVRARDEACPFLQDLWANNKLQILDTDAIDYPDRSQLRKNDVNLLIAALMHNSSLTSLTTSRDWQVSKRSFFNALAAIGAQGFTSLKHLCLVYTKGPYTEMLNILGGLFPNLEIIFLPHWWPEVAGLTGRCLESWPSLTTLAVDTVQPAAAILTKLESERGTCTLMQ
jgi:hypothetical protein